MEQEKTRGKVFNLLFKIAAVVVIVLVILVLNPFSTVGSSQRGIRTFLGKPSPTVLEPGLHTKVPLLGSIKKYSIVPSKMAIDIDIDRGGAISKDNQIIGTRIVVYYRFDEKRIYDVITRYSSIQSIENPLASLVNSSIKTIIGQYSVFELAQNQNKIGSALFEALKNNTSQYPIEIIQVNISNFDWSKDFDEQINKTMKAAQEVREAEQRMLITEQTNKQKIIEQEAEAKARIAKAEGDLKTAELQAQAQIEKARGEKESAILTAEGKSRANTLLAQNLAVEIRLKELEIEKIRAERWDGRQIPNYIPLTPTGGVVTLPAK